nr:hypothetical protein CFP56_48245 [Quercus suber]
MEVSDLMARTKKCSCQVIRPSQSSYEEALVHQGGPLNHKEVEFRSNLARSRFLNFLYLGSDPWASDALENGGESKEDWSQTGIWFNAASPWLRAKSDEIPDGILDDLPNASPGSKLDNRSSSSSQFTAGNDQRMDTQRTAGKDVQRSIPENLGTDHAQLAPNTHFISAHDEDCHDSKVSRNFILLTLVKIGL